MKNFNPRENVSIHNPWPRRRYPIRFGTKVYVRDGYGHIYGGQVIWYHPARRIDASCVITSGNPWYQVKLRDGHIDNFGADETRPRTRAGRRELEERNVRDLGNRTTTTQDRLVMLTKQLVAARSAWCRKWNRKSFPGQSANIAA